MQPRKGDDSSQNGFQNYAIDEYPYLLFVTDTIDGVCEKKIARCKFLQI